MITGGCAQAVQAVVQQLQYVVRQRIAFVYVSVQLRNGNFPVVVVVRVLNQLVYLAFEAGVETTRSGASVAWHACTQHSLRHSVSRKQTQGA